MNRTSFTGLFSLDNEGLKIFEEKFLSGDLREAGFDIEKGALTKKVEGTISFTLTKYETAKQMAQAVLDSLGTAKIDELIHDKGLWAWLTLILRDQLFQQESEGRWKVLEYHRWYPSDPDDWQKGQRHLVRMPVLLLKNLGKNADHLLCHSPMKLPEIREQLTSKNVLLDSSFQKVARTLYFNETTHSIKRGAAGRGGGSARRLVKVHQQLDLTWDFEVIGLDKILQKLPPEFSKFKPRKQLPTE